MGAGGGAPVVARDMPQFSVGGRVLNPKARAPVPSGAQMAEAQKMKSMREALSIPPDLSALATPAAAAPAVAAAAPAPTRGMLAGLRPAYA